MGESLQDQLRALGLARKPETKRAPKQSSRGRQPRRSGRDQPQRVKDTGEPSLEQAWALRENAERRQAKEARRRKLEDERRRRQINEAIRALVDVHRQNHPDAEIPRHFMYRGRIRKLYVTNAQQQALADGGLGIVYLTGGYHILAPEHVEEVRAISAGHVVDLGGESDDSPENSGSGEPTS
jgi:uncharacterized protein